MLNQPSIPPDERPASGRLIDPEVEKAARHSDIPDGNLYDIDTTTNTGPSSYGTLTLVVIACAVMVGVFCILFFHGL